MFFDSQARSAVMEAMKMTRRRKRRPKGNDRRLSGRPRNDERKNTVKWKRSVKKCGKKSETK